VNSGCTASCAPDYKFPNGAFHLTITCVDKKWHIGGTEWNSVPHCERTNLNLTQYGRSRDKISLESKSHIKFFIAICMPECQNNGICIAPHHCDCPKHFTGPQCQFEDRPCLNYSPPVLNSYKRCNSK